MTDRRVAEKNIHILSNRIVIPRRVYIRLRFPHPAVSSDDLKYFPTKWCRSTLQEPIRVSQNEDRWMPAGALSSWEGSKRGRLGGGRFHFSAQSSIHTSSMNLVIPIFIKQVKLEVWDTNKTHLDHLEGLWSLFAHFYKKYISDFHL